MSVATSTALIIGGVAAAGGAIAGSAISSGAAKNAASTQASAADTAAQLQAQEAANSLAFQQQEFNQTQANAAPFIQQGQGAVNMLGNALGVTPGPAPQPISVGAPPQVPGQAPTTANAATARQQLPGLAASTNAAPIDGLPANGTVANDPNATPLTPPTGTQFNQGPQPVYTPGQATPQLPGFAASVAGTGQATADTTPTNIGGVNYNLQTGGGTGTGALLQPWDAQFQAPTAAQAAQTPGYQFELGQGEQAMQNSAAAQGNLLNGGTEKALDQYANNVASTNYQQVYNNALNQYQQGYNQFENNQANTYNRLAGLAGTGQTAVTNLGSQGQSAANSVAGINQAAGAQIGANLNNAGAATASGYVGSANAINQGIGSATGSLNQTLSLLGLLGSNGVSTNVVNDTGPGGGYDALSSAGLF